MTTDWLKIAADAYQASTTYIDSNYRKRWEDDIKAFQSKHASDSKYNSEAYKHRSKIYRPKSRSVVRKNEAAAAAAFFSNIDVVNVEAEDQGDPAQLASAAVMKELLQYRLTKTIPWFMTLVGGLQDAQTMGVVCSYQYWDYQEVKEKVDQPVLVNGQQIIGEDGKPMTMEAEVTKIVRDKPCVELWPVENVRIDPGASWIDPIGTSPYVIRMIPMYVIDVKSKMEATDPKTGAPQWKKLTDGELRTGNKNTDDSTRKVREGERTDSKDNTIAVGDYEIVWVHENFVRRGNKELVYYTLGTEHLLSDPAPLKEVYFHGERPIVMGCCVIETHKPMPSGVITLGQELQKEANEIVNQRMDNVKLVLNKRYIAKRGAQVDLRSLVRNVPGSITLANDVNGDVREIEFNDVTASSYAEQDRINVDYDELVGNFSSGSVQTNRKMNETVGGMAMIAQGANQLTEYLLRTYTETWVEPVLRQLIKLEQYYETDEVVLQIAGQRAEIFQKYGIDRVTDDLLNRELTLSVNVGMNATDPNARMQKLLMGVNTYSQTVQTAPPNLNLDEVAKEIFGMAGYKDGSRFLKKEEDPRLVQAQQMLQQMQQAIAQLQQQLQAKDQEIQAKTAVDMADIQARQQIEADKRAIDQGKLQIQARMADIAEYEARLGAASAFRAAS